MTSVEAWDKLIKAFPLVTVTAGHPILDGDTWMFTLSTSLLYIVTKSSVRLYTQVTERSL